MQHLFYISAEEYVDDEDFPSQDVCFLSQLLICFVVLYGESLKREGHTVCYIFQGSVVGSYDGSDVASVLSHQDSDHGLGVS